MVDLILVTKNRQSPTVITTYAIDVEFSENNTGVVTPVTGTFTPELPTIAKDAYFWVNPNIKYHNNIGVIRSIPVFVFINGIQCGTLSLNCAASSDTTQRYPIFGKNVSGADGVPEFRLYVNDGGSIAYFLTTTFNVLYAPFTTVTDLYQKAQVAKLILIQLSTTPVSIEGITSIQNTIVEGDINNILKQFIFSANASTVLFDFTGSTFQVV